MSPQPELSKEAPQLPPQAVLIQMLTGRWITHMIHAAAKLNLADHLAAGPLTPADLAARTRTHAPSLYRLLRALASVGIFAEDAQGRFALTPLAEPLRSGVPGSVRGAAILFGEDFSLRVWGDLLRSVETGEPAFPRVYGMPAFEYFAKNPEVGRVFEEAMTGFSALTIPAVLAAYDFSEITTLVDVAGSHGSVLAAILQTYPAMRGILFDMPSLMPGAQKYLAEQGVDGRSSFVGGDFFASVPEGGDAYLLKNILHNWDDERCVTILKNCRRAMRPGGHVIAIDAVIEMGNAPSLDKLLDIEMLVMTQGGFERTEAQFRALFEAAGLRLARVVPTQSPFSIIEGHPA